MRLAATNVQDISALLDINRRLAYRPYKPAAGFLPMKDLARAERHFQIEIGRGNLNKFHDGSSSPCSLLKVNGRAAII
jgi:hypothetical protein